MIGVFDSGFGGLTILRNLQKALPQYDYLYLGDNARAPYGSRTFETIFRYTLQAVRELFSRGCPLVILACNTASAKALRSIQQDVLPYEFPDKRVLGIVRPTAEEIGKFSKSGHIGIFGTAGTVSSGSYLIEINHFYPELTITLSSQCRLLVLMSQRLLLLLKNFLIANLKKNKEEAYARYYRPPEGSIKLYFCLY